MLYTVANINNIKPIISTLQPTYTQKRPNYEYAP